MTRVIVVDGRANEKIGAGLYQMAQDWLTCERHSHTHTPLHWRVSCASLSLFVGDLVEFAAVMDDFGSLVKVDVDWSVLP